MILKTTVRVVIRQIIAMERMIIIRIVLVMILVLLRSKHTTVDGENRASPPTSKAWHVHRLTPLAPLMSMLITRVGGAGFCPFAHKPLLTVLGNHCQNSGFARDTWQKKADAGFQISSINSIESKNISRKNKCSTHSNSQKYSKRHNAVTVRIVLIIIIVIVVIMVTIVIGVATVVIVSIDIITKC